MSKRQFESQRIVDMKNKQVNADTDIVFISECSQIEGIMENPILLNCTTETVRRLALIIRIGAKQKGKIIIIIAV